MNNQNLKIANKIIDIYKSNKFITYLKKREKIFQEETVP